MSRLEEFLQKNDLWKELTDAVGKGRTPGAVGIVTHLPWQKDIVQKFASLALCENGTACGHCKSCSAWIHGEHPDLLVAGQPDEPASVDECRSKSADLSMSPVVAPYRLLVFYAPEKMSLGAVNSLLKITEEPPSSGRILYLMGKADILPTLRSRLWMLSLSIEESFEPLEPPSNKSAWHLWLRENGKKDADEWYAAACSYAAWLLKNGELVKASQLQQLAEVALTAHFSSPMWSDLLFLLLRGEYPFEYVFDDFRQTPLPGTH